MAPTFKDKQDSLLLNLLLDPPKEAIAFREAVKRNFNTPHKVHSPGFNHFEPNQSAFDDLCFRLDLIQHDIPYSDRLPLPMIHGTPGLGKSMFVDQFAAQILDWKTSNSKPALLSKASDWLRECVVICVTYDHNSSFEPLLEKDLWRAETLSLRVLWSYFFDDSKTAPNYRSFCESFFPLIRSSLGGYSLDLDQAIRVVQLHQSRVRNVPIENIKILLFIDELLMSRGSLQVNMLTREQRSKHITEAAHFLIRIASTMDSIYGLKIVLTSIDEYLFENFSLFYRRVVTCIELRPLSKDQSDKLLSPLKDLFQTDADPERRTRKERLIERCGIEASGYPAALKEMYSHLEGLLQRDEKDLTLGTVLERIMSSPQVVRLFEVNVQTLALALLGEPTQTLEQVIGDTAGMRDPYVYELVAAGVYVHSASRRKPLFPQITGLLLRYALRDVSKTFVASEQRLVCELLRDVPPDAPAARSVSQLKHLLIRLLDIEPSVGTSTYNQKEIANEKESGEAFERFHCLVELLKHHVRVICWSQNYTTGIVRGKFVVLSLREHYHIEDFECSNSQSPRWLIAESKSDTRPFKELTYSLCSLSLQTPLLWPLLISPDDYREIEENPFGELVKYVKEAAKKQKKGEDWSVPCIRSTERAVHGFDASMVVGAEAESGKEVWCILLRFEHEKTWKQISEGTEESPKDQRTSEGAGRPDEEESGNCKQKKSAQSDTVDAAAVDGILAVIKREKYVKRLRKAGAARVIYVVVAWKQLDVALIEHELKTKYFTKADAKFLTVLLMGREQLEKFYSPTLVPYAGYFAV